METCKYEFNRGYGHMVQDYYVEVVREIGAERKRRLKEIRNRKHAEKYQQQVLSAIKKSFPVPSVKTPLNPKVTGLLEKPGYRIEKVIFESRPGCLVTGNLYIPKGIREPVPGVLAPCGHSGIGKAENFYQQFCIRLVKSGFAVFIYDPISQGERDQYFRLPAKESVGLCCPAHNMMGKQMELIGDFFGSWRVWDGIRGLDYLLSRPEIDKKHIGLTGNSGGGTLTTWLWAVDDRFTMSAPSCFVTTFLANLENELPADNEQYPPGIIGAGVEHADFFIARAPKPVLLLGQQYDFFDRRGLKETYEEIRNFYRIYGAEANAGLFIGANVHGYFPDNQKQMLKFFCKQTGLNPYNKEVSSLVEKTENLWATRKGQVIDAGARPVYEVLGQTAKKIAEKRKRLSDSEVILEVKKILNVSMPENAPHYRILRPADEGEKTVTARYAVETERNVRTILHKRLTETAHAGTLDVEKTVHLFIPHLSAEQDMNNDPIAKKLVKKGPLYCLDVRGMGESLPDDSLDFFHPYGKDYMYHGHGLMLRQSYLGRRVYDILQVLNLLENEGADEIYLYGRGQGAILALFAGVLHKNIKKTVLKNLPLSFYEWTQVPVVTWPAANFPRGILKKLDIPDCLNILGKKVEVVEPWGPDMKPVKNR